MYTTCTVPFLACGDLSGWDADRNYELELSDLQQQQQQQEGAGVYVPLEPVQKPLAPVYRTAVDQLRSQGKT
jgi:tRNA (cytidine32/guanosine34-2'-O)-methyltransferase